MERIIVLGTGHGLTTKYYNTCFALHHDSEYLLIDAGGGNEILRRFEKAEINWKLLHNIYVTHEHADHVLGVIWVIRMIAYLMTLGQYDNMLNIYCNKLLAGKVKTICDLTLRKAERELIGDQIRLIPVKDGQTLKVMNYDITFFDIHSTKAVQYGFRMQLKNGQILTCLGDEPCNDSCVPYVMGSDWLLCEAYCLYSQRDEYTPYRYHHSTVKEASEIAAQNRIKNLILWHTEDGTFGHRKELYIQESQQYYHGNVFVPDDLDVINIANGNSIGG